MKHAPVVISGAIVESQQYATDGVAHTPHAT